MAGLSLYCRCRSFLYSKKVPGYFYSKFPNKQWQDLAYIVDVEVSYIQDSAKEYKITKLYKEEIFDPEEN